MNLTLDLEISFIYIYDIQFETNPTSDSIGTETWYGTQEQRRTQAKESNPYYSSLASR